MGAVFSAGFVLRLLGITDPMTDFAPTRQYRGALLARAFYLDSLESVTPESLELAWAATEPVLEPPVLEGLVSILYQVVGTEVFWCGRLVSVLAWMVGAAFLCGVARRFLSRSGALVVAALFLFLPGAFQASRAFMPDPMMLMGFLAFLYVSTQSSSRPRRHVVLACCVGATVLVKPYSLFPIFGVLLTRPGRPDSVFALQRERWLAVALCLVPAVLYYGLGLADEDGLGRQASQSFHPQLLFTPAYWWGWFEQLRGVYSLPWLGLGLVGGLLARQTPRRLLAGIWGGFGVMGLVFTHHISTHAYYQLLLLPAIALGVGSLFDWCREKAGVAGGLGMATVVGLLALSLTRTAQWYGHDPTSQEKVADWEEIGERVHHSTRVAMLSEGFGNPLRYHGRLAGPFWRTARSQALHESRGTPKLGGEAGFRALLQKEDPHYFVVTQRKELELQSELAEALNRFAVVAAGSDYVIYDLRKLQLSPWPFP